MSADRRKRKRKYQALLLEQNVHEQTPIEKTMVRQGKAINFMQVNTVKTPHLKRFYFCDRQKFNTGERVRHIG